MTNWLPTFPLLNRPPLQPDPRDLLAAFDGWSIAELMRNERFAQMPDESLTPTSAMNARAEPTAAWQPDWFTSAQRQAPPETASWPDPPSMPRPSISEDPFERAAIRLRRRSPRRYSPMGPPFLNEPPQDYPSHLGPVPQAPEWEQAITSPTSPWSPLSKPPAATAWGQVLTGIECRRTEDGRNINCITPGGRRVTVPAEDFPEYIGPGQPNYHYYNVPVRGGRVDSSRLNQGVIDKPTPGPRQMVRPATSEGTINEATPEPAYNATIALAQQLPGTPLNSVTSYLTYDQDGRPVVVNVTRRGHQLAPGVVIRYVTTGPSGSTIQNEGAGLGVLQAPGRWSSRVGLSDRINNVWGPQSRAIIEEQLRRQRR